MSILRRSAAIALRLIVAVGCCAGIWCSWNLARADYLFQKDTEESILAAISLVPDSSEYYMRLAQFDREHAQELLVKALSLNRYNAQANIELGLRYEAAGEYSKADKALLDAFEVDHTYLPRWSLANYYLRRNDIPAFWAWARRAAEMPADDLGPLFELCWRVSPDPEEIANNILNDKPEVVRQYLRFMLTRDVLPAETNVAQRLVNSGEPDTDRSLLFSVVNRLVAAGDASRANALWHSLIQRQWVLADLTVPNNGNFAREPLPVNFDWALPEYSGLHSWPGSSGLESEFSGKQPENCVIAEQAVVLGPGNYELVYTYHTSDIQPDTGIRWQITDVKSGTVLGDSTDLSSDMVVQSSLAFSVLPGQSLLRLRLMYRRTLGTPRIAGTLVLTSAQIRLNSKS